MNWTKYNEQVLIRKTKQYNFTLVRCSLKNDKELFRLSVISKKVKDYKDFFTEQLAKNYVDKLISMC